MADLFSHEHLTPRQVFEQRLLESLSKQFSLQAVSLADAEPSLHQRHMRSTTAVDVNGHDLIDPDLVPFQDETTH